MPWRMPNWKMPREARCVDGSADDEALQDAELADAPA